MIVRLLISMIAFDLIIIYCRLSVSVDTALKSFNPLSDIWHGVDRSLGFHGQIPFMCNISLDTNIHVSLGPLNGWFQNIIYFKDRVSKNTFGAHTK